VFKTVGDRDAKLHGTCPSELRTTFKATFKLRIPGGEDVFMNMWMHGQPDREIFSVQSPPSRAFGNGMLPRETAGLPLPTIVARQWGEAWTKPFIAVYEPSTKQPTAINCFDSLVFT